MLPIASTSRLATILLTVHILFYKKYSALYFRMSKIDLANNEIISFKLQYEFQKAQGPT